jgi:hypothetical protein
MMEISLQQLVENVADMEDLAIKLSLLIGMEKSGKTKTLLDISERKLFPVINLNLLVSQRLLPHTEKQRARNVEQIVKDVIHENLKGGICIDNTEILFEPKLKINPLHLLRNIARSENVVATWNGVLRGQKIEHAYEGHPEFFSQKAEGFGFYFLKEKKIFLKNEI